MAKVDPQRERQHWLVKTEPTAYSWDDLVRDGKTVWTGVRNFQARNHLRAMRRGDAVLFYHSVVGKQIVGLATVSREAYPDPTAEDGDWSCVEIEPRQKLKTPVSLEQIKSTPSLGEMLLVRHSRLSVMPISATDFSTILRLSETPAHEP